MDTLMETLVSNLYEMFLKGISTDFEIRIQDKIINAHKCILIARNSYFKCLLESNMQESQNNSVTIDDNYESFQAFLKYLYTGQLEQLDINEELLIIADKYLDTTLKTICEEVLCESIHIDNSAARLVIAVLHECPELKNAASQFITENFDQVKQTPEYRMIHKYDEAVDILFNKLNNLLISTKEQLEQKESYCKFSVNIPSSLCDASCAFNEQSSYIYFRDITWTVRVNRLISESFDHTALFYVFSKCDNLTYSSRAKIELKIISSKPVYNLLATNLDCKYNNTVLSHESMRLSALRPYIENGIIKIEASIKLYKSKM